MERLQKSLEGNNFEKLLIQKVDGEELSVRKSALMNDAAKNMGTEGCCCVRTRLKPKCQGD